MDFFSLTRLQGIGQCTIQCKDADSATALADLINKKMQDAKDDPTKRGDMRAGGFRQAHRGRETDRKRLAGGDRDRSGHDR